MLSRLLDLEAVYSYSSFVVCKTTIEAQYIDRLAASYRLAHTELYCVVNVHIYTFLKHIKKER